MILNTTIVFKIKFRFQVPKIRLENNFEDANIKTFNPKFKNKSHKTIFIIKIWLTFLKEFYLKLLVKILELLIIEVLYFQLLKKTFTTRNINFEPIIKTNVTLFFPWTIQMFLKNLKISKNYSCSRSSSRFSAPFSIF